jgi:hypothetical protein
MTVKVAGWGSVRGCDGRCMLCGAQAVEGDNTAFALPMYEGRVDWTSEIHFPVCRECYDKHPFPNASFEFTGQLRSFTLATIVRDQNRGFGRS